MTVRVSTSGASSYDSTEIAKLSRGTTGPTAQANADEVTMLAQTLRSAFSKRPWCRP